MHYKEYKSILSAKNGLNATRGCTHGCIYCDSRSTCYHIDHAFEDIEIKSNAAQILKQQLRSRKNKCMISFGSMSDPYLPLENEIKQTRRILEVIYEMGFGVTLITKSASVLQDLDLLVKINERSKCVVQMTLTTSNEDLCKIVEPHVSSTKQRVEALQKLGEAGIETVVWMVPFLPRINDTEENIRGLVEYCKKAKVKRILNFGISLTLREGNREYYYEQLDKYFVGLRQWYEHTYKESYVLVSPNHKQVMQIFEEECDKAGIIYDTKEIFTYLHTFPTQQEQLSLF